MTNDQNVHIQHQATQKWNKWSLANMDVQLKIWSKGWIVQMLCGSAGRMCSSLKTLLSDSELRRCNRLTTATVIGQSALLVAPPTPTLVEAVQSADDMYKLKERLCFSFS